jgi:hypothetical protein
MKHGHGATSNRTSERVRRNRQRQTDRIQEERNRRKSTGGGQPNELGVTQGQNGEQGNTVDPRNVNYRGHLAH